MKKRSTKLYTEPKISPAEPESKDMASDWYVWFRFFDVATDSWKQLRYKKGINEFHNFRERLAEANALRQAIKEQLKDGWNPLLKDEQVIRIYSMREALEFILKLKIKTLKKKTGYAYTYIINHFLTWLKGRNIDMVSAKKFTGVQAQEYMDHLTITKNYSGRTFNDHLLVLRTFFNCLVDRDWILKNPFKAVKWQKQTIGRNLAYTDAEKTLLEKELYESDRRLYYFTQIMYHCFIRRTEIASLKVKHIDMINKTILIPGENAKNMRQEGVVIPKGLEEVLKEMDLGNYSSECYVFGRRLFTCHEQYKNPNWISTRHSVIARRLKIHSEKNLYSWKHTGVCSYYHATKDPYALMRQLRHRDLKTTMIYLKSMGLIQNESIRNALVA